MRSYKNIGARRNKIRILGGKNMKRIIKINENEYISKEVEHINSLTGTIIELIIYLSLLAALTKFVNNWL